MGFWRNVFGAKNTSSEKVETTTDNGSSHKVSMKETTTEKDGNGRVLSKKTVTQDTEEND